jgi:F-type H+-transporting ATPase subunit b
MRSAFDLRWLAMVLCALGCAAPVFGADDGHGGGAANPLSIMFDTALWSIVVFLLLVIILHRRAWGPILEGLKKREETIRTSLEEAKKTREDMDRMRAEFHKEMSEAQQKIPLLMEEARKKGDELAAQKLAEATAKIQADQERFRHEMEIAKDVAIKDLWAQAAQLATQISAKAIGRSLNEDDHRRLIDEAMKEMVSRN